MAPKTDPPKITTKPTYVTPEMAQEWLEKNNSKNYRSLSLSTAQDYAALMKAGTWPEWHPDAIQFDWNGDLGNGQHRLKAVVLSGKTIGMFVSTGHDPATFLVTDKGRKRTLADDLEFLGFKSDNRLLRDRCVSAARRMIIGLSKATNLATPELVHKVCMEHGAIIKEVVMALSGSKPYKAEVAAAFAKAMFEFDDRNPQVLDQARRFAERRFTGRDDPLNRLHERCLSAATAPVYYGSALSAVQAAMDGREVRCLYVSEGDFAAPWEPGYIPVEKRIRGRKSAATMREAAKADAINVALRAYNELKTRGATFSLDAEGKAHVNLRGTKNVPPHLTRTLAIPEVMEAMAMVIDDTKKEFARG